MKFLGFCSFQIFLLLLSPTIQAQEVNVIRIIPAEPTSTDTISVISDFSYEGACAFGLVYEFIYTTDTSILILPTYCGHFNPDSVLCQSIDSFKIPPLTAGTYQLQIEYHQGSICPISDFDAVIASFDTILVISGTQSIPKTKNEASLSILIYPNPASDMVTIHIDPFENSDVHGCALLNTFGQVLLREKFSAPLTHLQVTGLKGIFILECFDATGRSIAVRKLILQ